MNQPKDVRSESRTPGPSTVVTDGRLRPARFLSRRDLFALLAIAATARAATGGDCLVMHSGWILRTSDLVDG